MLEQLFGSKTRVKLLRLFLNNSTAVFYVRELSRSIDAQINAVRRELNNLESLGLLLVKDAKSLGREEQAAQSANMLERDKKKFARAILKEKISDAQKKYYQINAEFPLLPELKALMFKSDLLLERDLVPQLKKICDLKYLVLAGVFVGDRSANVDLLLVGQANQTKLKVLIGEYEKSLGREINYTLMTKEEYVYRKSIADRFLFSILEQKHVVAIDEIEK